MRIIIIILCLCSFCAKAQEELAQNIKALETLMYAHKGELALEKIDSIYSLYKIDKDLDLYLKSFKIEALVQAEKYESALLFSSQLIKNPNLKGVPLIRTHIERALLYEIAGELDNSKKSLDFVRDYYTKNNVKKDELYGEYLYRLSSWFKLKNLKKDAILYAEKSVEFGKLNQYKNVEATGYMLLGMTAQKTNSDKQIDLYKKALSLWKVDDNFYHMDAIYSAIANYYGANKEYKKAYQYIDSSINATNKIKDFYIASNGYKYKSSLYEKQGDIKQAFLYYKK